MYDRVIKAYLASFDANLRIPYLEKKTVKDDLIIIASIYKGTGPKQFYCLAVIIQDGEYHFEDVAGYSRYYDSEEIMTKDIAQDTISSIVQQIMFRKRLLTFISNNPNLPSVLSTCYTQTLMLYYAVEGKLRIAKLYRGDLVINLPPAEQVYLKELLEEFKIRVLRTAEELPYHHGLS